MRHTRIDRFVRKVSDSNKLFGSSDLRVLQNRGLFSIQQRLVFLDHTAARGLPLLQYLCSTVVASFSSEFKQLSHEHARDFHLR